MHINESAMPFDWFYFQNNSITYEKWTMFAKVAQLSADKNNFKTEFEMQ